MLPSITICSSELSFRIFFLLSFFGGGGLRVRVGVGSTMLASWIQIVLLVLTLVRC